MFGGLFAIITRKLDLEKQYLFLINFHLFINFYMESNLSLLIGVLFQNLLLLLLSFLTIFIYKKINIKKL